MANFYIKILETRYEQKAGRMHVLKSDYQLNNCLDAELRSLE